MAETVNQSIFSKIQRNYSSYIKKLSQLDKKKKMGRIANMAAFHAQVSRARYA